MRSISEMQVAWMRAGTISEMNKRGAGRQGDGDDRYGQGPGQDLGHPNRPARVARKGSAMASTATPPVRLKPRRRPVAAARDGRSSPGLWAGGLNTWR